jgi:hypothetical protein
MARAMAKSKSEIPAKLTGCVVAGEAKDTFLLTKGLREHVGQRVEVRGIADLGDYEKGRVEVKTEDGRPTMKVKAGDARVKADPNVWAGTMGATKMKTDIATYSFEVKHVKRVDGSCL